MNQELAGLEQKIEQVLALCQGLRAENQELRTRIAVVEADKRRLNEKIEVAGARLEALMEKLPEES
jgi:cell division protein ZapB